MLKSAVPLLLLFLVLIKSGWVVDEERGTSAVFT